MIVIDDLKYLEIVGVDERYADDIDGEANAYFD